MRKPLPDLDVSKQYAGIPFAENKAKLVEIPYPGKATSRREEF